MWSKIAAAVLLTAGCQPPIALAKEVSESPSRLLFSSKFTLDRPIEDITVPLMKPTKNSEDLVQKSSSIVRGFVEGFLHREHLKPGEMQCIEKGASDLAQDVVALSSNVARAFQAAAEHERQEEASTARTTTGTSETSQQSQRAGGANDVAADARAGEESYASTSAPVPAFSKQTDEDKAAERARTMESLRSFYGTGRRLSPSLLSLGPGLFLQLGLSVEKMASMTHDIVKDCLRSDAKAALDVSVQHMRDVRYVSGHLIANGEDIVAELADSVTAYQSDRSRDFGAGMGKALRKTLLSSSGDGELPNGLPSEYCVANVTEGLLEGLFSRGSEVKVKVPSDSNLGAASEISIDLHSCVKDNLNFLRNAWAEVMWLFANAREATSPKSRDAAQWSTAVALSMLEVPDALKKCNLGSEQQEILEHALRALASGGRAPDINVKAPQDAAVSKRALERHVAVTAKDWAKNNWKTFGQDLGRLLQEMAVTAYSQKFEIDEHGVLRKRLVGLSEDLSGSYTMLSKASFATRAFAAAASGFLACALVIRLRRGAVVSSSGHHLLADEEFEVE